MNNIDINKIKESYKYCSKFAHSHYENFPVASIFLPKKIREPISAIYTFARQADDFADEGAYSKEHRLDLLNNYWQNLNLIENNNNHSFSDSTFIALKDTIKRFNLPIYLFYDLLKAFKQDVNKNRYQNFDEVLEYCKYSANPIGRLLLHLTKNDSDENLILSDNICTGLQLINFLQDINVDLQNKNRVYLPLDELAANNIGINDLKAKDNSANVSKFVTEQINKVEQIFESGTSLGQKLPGLLGIELKLMIEGGRHIIYALKNRDNIYARPTLKKLDYLKMLLNSFKNSRFK